MKSVLVALATCVASTVAWSSSWQSKYADLDVSLRGHIRLPGKGNATYPPHTNVTTGNSTFKQLIDHNNPSLGTFDQFYYWSTEFWKGPGSPVIMFTPGEINATGYNSYLSINRTTGVMAQQLGAAGKRSNGRW